MIPSVVSQLSSNLRHILLYMIIPFTSKYLYLHQLSYTSARDDSIEFILLFFVTNLLVLPTLIRIKDVHGSSWRIFSIQLQLVRWISGLYVLTCFVKIIGGQHPKQLTTFFFILKKLK